MFTYYTSFDFTPIMLSNPITLLLLLPGCVRGWLPTKPIDLGTPCYKDYNLGGCYGCGYTLRNQKCKKGYEVKKTGEKCGLLNIKCKAECKFEGEQEYDHGCGCGEGKGCLDIDCQLNAWSKWSSCQDDGGKVLVCNHDAPIQHGFITRTRTIRTRQKNNGAPCGEMEEKEACDTHNCTADCKMTKWSSWSVCDKRCGGGTQRRTRSIKQHPVGEEAKACPTNVEETQTCNDFACFYYSIEGEFGWEQVTIEEKTITLDRKKSRNTNNADLTIKVLAELDTSKVDTSDKDVQLFVALAAAQGPRITIKPGENPNGRKTTGTAQYMDKWDDWKCGQSDEKPSCDKVRNGKFNWVGEYLVKFDDYTELGSEIRLN